MAFAERFHKGARRAEIGSQERVEKGTEICQTLAGCRVEDSERSHHDQSAGPGGHPSIEIVDQKQRGREIKAKRDRSGFSGVEVGKASRNETFLPVNFQPRRRCVSPSSHRIGRRRITEFLHNSRRDLDLLMNPREKIDRSDLDQVIQWRGVADHHGFSIVSTANRLDFREHFFLRPIALGTVFGDQVFERNSALQMESLHRFGRADPTFPVKAADECAERFFFDAGGAGGKAREEKIGKLERECHPEVYPEDRRIQAATFATFPS